MERPTPSVTGIGTNLKIQLIGHCIICLKRTKREYDRGGRTPKLKNNYGEDYAPRAIIASPGFLDTFNVIWEFLQKKHGGDSDDNSGKGGRPSSEGISLETVLTSMEDGSENINAKIMDAPPTICLQCCEKVVSVQDMMKVLRYQIEEIEVLVKESRGIQVYTLEVENYKTKAAEAKAKGRRTEDKLEAESKGGEIAGGTGNKSKVEATFGDDDDSYYGFNMQLNPETGEWEEPPPQPSGSGGSHQDKKLPQPSASYSSDLSDHGGNFGGFDGGDDDDERMSDNQDDYNPNGGGGAAGDSGPGNNGNRPAILRGKRIKWQELKISEEELDRDWRRRAKYKQNYGCYMDYYCAYGKGCQRKVKKKTLKNGVSITTTNGLPHSNHRRIHFGLTDVQKEFIVKCVKEGVTQPNNILLSFYAQNVKAPEKLQLSNWLARNKRNRTFENL